MISSFHELVRLWGTTTTCCITAHNVINVGLSLKLHIHPHMSHLHLWHLVIKIQWPWIMQHISTHYIGTLFRKKKKKLIMILINWLIWYHIIDLMSSKKSNHSSYKFSLCKWLKFEEDTVDHNAICIKVIKENRSQ